MTNEMVKKFIEEHSFCPELLFRDWEPFLDLLYAEGGAVSAICWWDRCRKSELHESVGAGGYADPDDPEYMYAETQLCAENLGARNKSPGRGRRASSTETNTAATTSCRRSSLLTENWGDAVGIALPRFFVFRTRMRATKAPSILLTARRTCCSRQASNCNLRVDIFEICRLQLSQSAGYAIMPQRYRRG